MTPITLTQRFSYVRYLLYPVLLLPLLLLSGGRRAGTDGAGQRLGWAISLGLSLGLSRLLLRVTNPPPRLTLDDEGVTSQRLGAGKIAWADVMGAFLRESRGLACLFLELRDPDRDLTRLSGGQRRLAASHQAVGNPPIALDLTGMRVDAPALLATVRQRAGLPPQ